MKPNRIVQLIRLALLLALALPNFGCTGDEPGAADQQVVDITGDGPTDTTPPETTIDSGPTGTVSNNGATFAFSCSESDCTFECRLDAGTWEACTSPKTYSALADGEHAVEVRAKDAAGNVDATPATRTWTVDTTVPDTTPPETSIDGGPSETTSDTDADFTFSCTEGACTYECRLDAGGWTSCTSPKNYSGLADVTYTFEVQAYDAALNVDATPASRTWTVDASIVAGHHWVSIPGGSFDMGDASDSDGVAPSDGDGYDDELPVHAVTISAFEMYAYEVTNGEYAACVSAAACTAPGNTGSWSGRSPYYGNATYAAFPVIYVDWQQSTDFCAWVGGRLPTAAEGEYAARGGLSAKRFPWGDTIDCTQANYFTENSYAYDVDPFVGSKMCVGDTTAVGSYATNGYGLYDMAGNVWEWVNDWYATGYYSVSPSTDPQGPATGASRVVRGGSFNDLTNYTRLSTRNYYSPTWQFNVLGFRCAR